MNNNHAITKAISFTIGAISSFLISSCCFHVKCDCNTPPLEISLKMSGYDPEELDTFIVKRYTPGTNFTQLRDSSINGFNYNTGPDTTINFHAVLIPNLSSQFDIVITNISDSQSVYISNIQLKDTGNDGGCCDCGGLVTKDYLVNGTHSFEKNGLYTVRK